MIITFRPIKVWPDGWQDPNRHRPYSPFSASYRGTLTLLDSELSAINATDCTMQVDASDRDIRADGQLRADAKVRHPGVILTIETKKLGTLVYATDKFDYGSSDAAGSWARIEAWQGNLRAIALGLEALRKIERYGIAERGQQYAGYRELGSGIPMGAVPATMTVEEAAAIIAGGGKASVADVLTDRGAAERAYRDATKLLHPDRPDGDTEKFKRLQEAWRIVLEAHGVR